MPILERRHINTNSKENQEDCQPMELHCHRMCLNIFECQTMYHQKGHVLTQVDGPPPHPAPRQACLLSQTCVDGYLIHLITVTFKYSVNSHRQTTNDKMHYNSKDANS